MNQKLEDLLQLALQTPEEVRARTEELNVGFDGAARTWELIVKYHGSLDVLRTLGIKIEYLIAGYAILTVPEGLVENIVELEQIEYVEKPKRYFYGRELPTDGSCIAQVTLREPNLTGRGTLIAVIDSGEGVREMLNLATGRLIGQSAHGIRYKKRVGPKGDFAGRNGGNRRCRRLARISCGRIGTGLRISGISGSI